MTFEPRRTFTLIDAMILIAATAIALALVRTLRLAIGPQSYMSLSWFYYLGLESLRAVLPFLESWTLALFILALIPPKPTSRRLFRQSGMVACCAAMMAFLINLIEILSTTPLIGPSSGLLLDTLPHLLRFWIVRGNFTVPHFLGGAWLTLILCGRWKRGQTWVDHAATVLGFAWIAQYVALLFITFLWACFR